MELKEEIKEGHGDVNFLIFLTFLIGFLVARAWRLYPAELGPSLKFGEEGIYTAHHLYYGVILLIVAAWLSINYEDDRARLLSAVFYGGGLGIFFDQIGYIITEFEDYHTSLTYYVVVSTSLVLLNLVFFKDFWRSFGSEIRDFAEEKDLHKAPLKIAGLMSFLDWVERNYPRREDLISLSLGGVLIAIGLFVLIFPTFLRFYVSGAFILTGVARLIILIR
ncbi:MAG: hypothetical protein ACOCSA_03025 [Candidatus Hadarchaeota archaeon]